MAYSFQTFSVGQVLTAAQMNQVEVNIRDHIHGVSGVSSVLLDVDTSDTTIVNDATEQTVYSFTVAGGTLSTNRLLRLTVFGEILNNSGTARTLTLRAKYGGTQFAGPAIATIASSASRRAVRLTALLAADGATNAQQGQAELHVGSAVGVAGPDGTATAGAANLDITAHTALAIDSTTNQTLLVTVLLGGTAHASWEYVMRAAYLEAVR